MGELTKLARGEVVDAEIVDDDAPLSTAEARALTDRICVNLDGLWEMVIEAFQRGAHRVLGYKSWDEYCEIEFGSNRIRLPREERQETVRSLREAGLSIRAIASATGIGDKTVQRDIRSGVVNDYTSSLGADGKTYAASVAAARERSERNAREAKREWDEAQAQKAVGINEPEGLKILADTLREARASRPREQAARGIPADVRKRMKAREAEWDARHAATPQALRSLQDVVFPVEILGREKPAPVEQIRAADFTMLADDARELFTDEGLDRLQHVVDTMRELQAEVLAAGGDHG